MVVAKGDERMIRTPHTPAVSRRLLLGGFAATAAALPRIARAAGKTSIAVADFDFEDTSGEPADQTAAHNDRLGGFTQYLRDSIAKSGKFTLVKLPCKPDACSAGTLQGDDLMNLAKKTDAQLLVFGGIHKISTLIEFADIEIANVKTGQSVLHRSVTFRGDSDDAWHHAAEFCTSMILQAS
jgi:hypothetical protein